MIDKVNYQRADRSYPFTIEEDIQEHNSLANDVYYVTNLVSDFLNYVVFVIINFWIDIYMLVRLRRTLNDKMKKYAALTDSTQMSKKEIEMRELMNNAIRMVVVNSTLNFLFKLPHTLVPLQNTIETFYYQSGQFYKNRCGNKCNFGFYRFSVNLRDSNVYYLVSDLGEWLQTILISIQLFIFSKFDKKIKMGFHRMFDFSLKKPYNDSIHTDCK